MSPALSRSVGRLEPQSAFGASSFLLRRREMAEATVFRVQSAKLETTKKITPVIPRTKCERWRIDSAGVERGPKMLGTGLSRGLAVHNPAARKNSC